MSKVMDTLTKDVKAKRKLPPIVHIADNSVDPFRGLCGAKLKGVTHPWGEENCVVCIELRKAQKNVGKSS